MRGEAGLAQECQSISAEVSNFNRASTGICSFTRMTPFCPGLYPKMVGHRDAVVKKAMVAEDQARETERR